MPPSPAISWLIRSVLIVHFAWVCVWGLYARGYLPEPSHTFPLAVAGMVYLLSFLPLLACPLAILILAMVRPSRAAAYAIVAEVLLIYASAIAGLPAVQ